jgi:hypothetical protein
VGKFIGHATLKHSREERAEHRLEISEMLRPWLSKVEPTYWHQDETIYRHQDEINLLRKELAE